MQKQRRPAASKRPVLTKEKNKDAGLLLILAFLICYFHYGNRLFLQLSALIALLAILLPGVLKPLSLIWYRVSELLAAVMSRIVLSIVFFGVIAPIGLLRRLFSAKRLLTEQWKKDNGSVFTVRNKQFDKSDLVDPY